MSKTELKLDTLTEQLTLHEKSGSSAEFVGRFQQMEV